METKEYLIRISIATLIGAIAFFILYTLEKYFEWRIY